MWARIKAWWRDLHSCSESSEIIDCDAGGCVYQCAKCGAIWLYRG